MHLGIISDIHMDSAKINAGHFLTEKKQCYLHSTNLSLRGVIYKNTEIKGIWELSQIYILLETLQQNKTISSLFHVAWSIKFN